MKHSIQSNIIDRISGELKLANDRFNTVYPGESSERQPVHTVYGGAHIFKANTAHKLGAAAVEHLVTYAPNYIVFAKVLHLKGYESLPNSPEEIQDYIHEKKHESDPDETRKNSAIFSQTIYNRVLEKLKREAIEDFRIDFEDGYGYRPDDEEDGHAIAAAEEMAKGIAENSLPPYIGIRIKSLAEDQKCRAIRTLDIFITSLLEKTGGALPNNFVVTLPMVTIPEQVYALVRLFEALELKTGLPSESLKMELMIETPQTILDSHGNSAIHNLVKAANGRCIGVHFGVYDYTALINLTADQQSMQHPSCDFARHMMQVALAGTGIRLSDGVTNILPVGLHRSPDENPLTKSQFKENQESVFQAWRLNFSDIHHSLKHGFYQGWDLHPSQLAIRYAAIYSFFLQGLIPTSRRLKSFMDQAAQASLIGDIFDDAASGQALLNYFLRGISCGAITEKEAEVTGLTLIEIRTRSFKKILEMRVSSKS